jgi:hypothetical protein
LIYCLKATDPVALLRFFVFAVASDYHNNHDQHPESSLMRVGFVGKLRKHSAVLAQKSDMGDVLDVDVAMITPDTRWS